MFVPPKVDRIRTLIEEAVRRGHFIVYTWKGIALQQQLNEKHSFVVVTEYQNGATLPKSQEPNLYYLFSLSGESEIGERWRPLANLQPDSEWYEEVHAEDGIIGIRLFAVWSGRNGFSAKLTTGCGTTKREFHVLFAY